MKSLLLRDKEFLRELYESNNLYRTKKLLENASDAKLNTLIRYFHFISNGEISIKKHHFELLSKKQLNLIRKNFEKKSSLTNLLNEERSVKLKLIKVFSSVYSSVLSPLFNL